MNERIREFAEQARKHFPKTETSGEFWVFDEQKFAELIVQECMACSTWVGRMNKTAIEPVHTAYTINQRIKEHFGVEE